MPPSPRLVFLSIALVRPPSWDARTAPALSASLGFLFLLPFVAFFANVALAAHARSWLFGIVRTGMLHLTVDTPLQGTFRFVGWCRQRCSIWPMVAL